MRRSGRVRRGIASQSVSYRGQRGRRRQGRSRGSNRRTSALSTSIPQTLRRSARLNPDPEQPSTVSTEAREAEAEANRQIARQEDRRIRETERVTENLRHISPHGRQSGREIASNTSGIVNAGSNMDSERPLNNVHPTPSDRTYFLDIAVQPPSVVRSGAPLYPPLVVRVHIHDTDGSEITGEDELSRLFAQASLYPESGNSLAIAPPDVFLLSGRLSMSLDLVDDPGDVSSGTQSQAAGSAPPDNLSGSYALFPDLTINRAGRYRLGVSLFRVDNGRRVRSASNSPTGADPQSSIGGGISLDEVKSNVVTVQDGPTPVDIDDAARAFLNYLRGRGANVPSPTS